MTTAVANIAPGGGNQNNGGQQKKNTRRGNRFNNKGFKAHNQNNFKPWQQQQQQPQYGNNGGGRGGQGRGGRGQAFNGGRGGRFNNAGRGQGRGGYMNGRGGFHGNNGNYNGNPQQGNNSNSGNNFGNNNFNGGFNNGNNNGGFFQPTPHTMMMNINELNGYNNNNRNQHHGNQSGNHHQNNNNQQAPYDAQWSADANRMARNNRSNHNNYSMNQQYNGYGNVTIAAMSRKVLDDPNNPVYFIDSGATFSHRVSAYRLSDITPNLTAVQTADGKCVYSREIGFIGNLRFHITPEFKYNLISVKELNKVHDWYAIFKNGICEVRDNTDILVFKTRESSSLGDSQELFCIDEMSLQLSLKVYWEKKVEEQLQKQAQAQVSVMSHEFCGTLPPIVFAALPAPQQCENHRIIDCQVCSDSVPPREVSQFLLIHSRLHCHLEKCKELLKYVEGFEKVTFRRRDQLLAPCKLCVESCMHSRGYAHQSSQDEIRTPFSVVHVDLKGPIEVTGVNGEKYILGIVDSYSKYIFQYYLKTKDEAHIYMEKFIVEHVTFVSKLWQSNRNNEPVTTIELILSSVISDQGGEFISANFRNTCERFGIRHSILPAYGPQLNGTVERTWKQVFQLVRIFLIQSQLPSKYWPFAAMHATYIINRTTLYSIKQHKSSKRGLTRGTPYQHLYLKKPNISHIKQFGCNLYTFIHPQQRDQPNFSPRAFEGKLLGFVDTFPNVHTAIVVQLNQINSIKPTIVTVDRDNCKYVEQQVFSYNTFNGDSVFSQELEQGTRLSTHDNPSVLSSVGQNNSSVMDEDTINMTIMDILNSPYAAQWIEAIKKEFQTIEKNNVWRLIDFLPGRGKKKLGTKWVFRTKIDNVTNEKICKARLVIKGFQAIDGEDFISFLIYAPVAKLPSLRIFLAVVTQLGLYIIQLDVESAFQMAQLDEEIYIEIPEGFTLYFGEECMRGMRNPCLILDRALYGLPQSPKAWYNTIDKVLKQLGYIALNNEPCLYKKMDEQGNLVAITILYVDDMLMANSSQVELRNIILCLKKEFSVKVTWEPKKILGINFRYERTNGFTTIDQKDKIEDLEKFLELEGNNRVNLPATPLDQSTSWFDVNKEIDKPLTEDESSLYRTLLGKIMYIMTASRPDICFAVSVLSRYTQNPMQKHLYGVKHVAKYLIATIDQKIIFKRQPFDVFKLVAYSDSDWATDRQTRRSQTGGIIMLAGSPIVWLSTQQTSVALSSTEAEINALRSVVKQVLWVRNVLKELKLTSSAPTTIFEDNTSAIKLVHNPAVNNTNRHTDISHKFINENILEFKTIHIEQIPTLYNIADIFTKNTKPKTFNELCYLMFNGYKYPLGKNIL
jgi:hypothetical protein